MLNPADAAFRDLLSARLPGLALRDAAPADLEEPRGRWHGIGTLVALPATVEEVAEVVKVCAGERVGILPRAGGTGLVGGGVVPGGVPPLLLSVERMRAIRSVHPEENVLVAEAGVVLADVQAAASAAGRLFPLSLASEGSARVGGLLATNAGGTGVLRYGNARDLCLGIEAVLPDGSILRGLKRLRKDNTGYDLRHLLIGAEGTLGIITAAALRLHPRPAAVGAALLAVPSPASALTLLALAQDMTGGAVTAFELMHRTGFDFLAATGLETRFPMDPMPDWTVLVEVAGGPVPGPASMLSDLFEAAAGVDLVSDGVVAQSEYQRAAFWRLRETIPEANRRIGAVASHDVSVPLSEIAAFIDRAPAAIAHLGAFRVNCFGHVGDGNLHWNVFPAEGARKQDHDNVRDAVQRAVHDLAHDLGGSVSAEHGIGRLKVDDLERYADPAKLAAMRAVKAALDPLGILNPGAVLRN
jgi:FAD/FMN-containing dehydrogenase